MQARDVKVSFTPLKITPSGRFWQEYRNIYMWIELWKSLGQVVPNVTKYVNIRTVHRFGLNRRSGPIARSIGYKSYLLG